MKKVYLKNGGGAFVDDEDYEKVWGYEWYGLKGPSTTYAVTNTNTKGRLLSMHRLVMDAPPDTVVDHRDRNGLNNCRHNLRLCTQQQNLWNRKRRGDRPRSPYLGVWVKRNGRYATLVSVDGKQVYFGTFINERDAALMYDAVVRRTRGEFATLNFPDEHYSEEELQRRRTSCGGPKKVAATP